MSVVIKGLTAGYGRGAVLKDITADIGTGCICALIGANGSGKTTLMRCINAILKPMEGRIFVMGKDISRLDRNRIARLISVVPQSSSAPFSFSCIEMVLMGGTTRIKPWASPSQGELEQARRVCEDVGIPECADMPFNYLSGGQKQLVMLARALYQAAPVMLLDEPNSHLDFSNQHRTMGLIRRIVRERGVTALVTLHDPNLALHYCDKVIMIKVGAIVAEGPTHEIMDDRYLSVGLGDNITVDETVRGVRFVVPRRIIGENERGGNHAM